MGAIKTTDIINGAEVSKEIQLVVAELNKLVVAMGKTNAEVKKGETSQKKMTQAQKEAAAQAKKEAQLEKELVSAQKKTAAQLNRLSVAQEKRNKARDKERSKQQEIIRLINSEAKSDAELNAKLAAQRKYRENLNRTTAKGSAEYKRITGEIQKTAAAVDKAKTSQGQYNQRVGNYPKLAAGAVAAFAAVAMGVRMVSRHVKESIDAFLIQDDINLKVANTFGEYANQINNAANATQALTRVGNEQYQKLAVLASNMGVANGEVNQTVQDSIGLAELFVDSGLSQETAMKGLALAQNGNYTQLQRYIPALREATSEEEKAAILKEITAKGFAMAEKNAASYQGRLTQMKNAYGDLQEVIGGQVLGGLFDPADGGGIVDTINSVIKALEKTKFITTLMDSWAKPAKEFGDIIQKLGKAFGITMDSGDMLSGILTFLTKTFEFATLPVQMLIAVVSNVVDYFISLYAIVTDLKNFKIEDIFDLIKQSIVNLISPITDFLGLTSELNSLLGTAAESAHKSTVEFEKLQAVLSDPTGAAKKYIEEQEELAKIQKDATDAAEKEEKAISSAQSAYESFAKSLQSINNDYEKNILLLKTKQQIDDETIKRDQAIFDATLDYYGKVTPAMQSMIDAYSVAIVEGEKLIATKRNLNIVTDDEISLLKEAKTEVETYADIMEETRKNIEAAYAKSQRSPFEKLMDGAKGFASFMETNGQAIEMVLGSIGDAFTASYDNQIAGIERTQEKNDAYYDNLIANYEGDEAAQAQLEQAKATEAEKSQEKLIALQRKKAIVDKAQSLFNILISTATGIAAALGSIPPNPILAAAIGVTGAVQAGIVASTPLPQYRVGLDDAKTDHVGIVGDAGPEFVNYPDGSSAYFSTPTAIMIPKHTSIDTAHETAAKLRNMEFNISLDKLHKNSEKQVSLLHLIAKNTGKTQRTTTSRDMYYLTHYTK